MTLSMNDLEERTEIAYEEVSFARVDIALTERKAKRLRLQIVIATILMVPIIVGVVAFAPWFAAIAPAFMLGLGGGLAVRRLYWLNNVELPHLTRKYHKALTTATEALQDQEERRQLRLLNVEEYDRIEREVDAKRLKEQEAIERRKRQEYEDGLWDEAFRLALKRPSLYSWM